MCQIDVEWFPFDAQTCEMKFGMSDDTLKSPHLLKTICFKHFLGSWTYGGLEVDLKVLL